MTSNEGKATVYKFSMYNINTDTMMIGRRYATREAIKTLGLGSIDEASGVEVDRRILDSNGMTPSGYDPKNPQPSGDPIPGQQHLRGILSDD